MLTRRPILLNQYSFQVDQLQNKMNNGFELMKKAVTFTVL